MDSKNKLIGIRRPICIVDYGMGNVTSVEMAFRALRIPCQVSRDVDDIVNSDGLVLPGVGAFRVAMENLKRLHLLDAMDEAVNRKKTPFLGICLGMQLLAKSSTEGCLTEGMGWIDGSVEEIPPKAGFLVPHVGWNNVEIVKDTLFVNGIDNDTHYYFDHSYRLVCGAELVSATCNYGENIVAIIEKDNIIATQFHPEKSQRNGLRILRKFLDLMRQRDFGVMTKDHNA